MRRDREGRGPLFKSLATMSSVVPKRSVKWLHCAVCARHCLACSHAEVKTREHHSKQKELLMRFMPVVCCRRFFCAVDLKIAAGAACC